MKKIYLSLLTSLLMTTLYAQEKLTISGYVKDAKNGEVLIGAGVTVKELKSGNSTNVYGFYSISIPPGQYTLLYNYVGYQTITKTIDLKETIKMDVDLNEDAKELDAVVISAEREDGNVKNVEMSVNKMDIKTIQKIPALLGEVDVIRSIQLLPGVSTIGEGASGFNVRGGGVDQNLVLLDEAPVYNSSHLFGFFSVFNPDAVKDVKLIKGGIPAQYGGRISSILDVRMKDGNNKRFSGSGGVGVIFSRLALEGPIVKEKGSFIVAARRSYIDVLAKPFLNKDLKDSRFNFYDLTAKANYTINSKNRVFISAYSGRDIFGGGFTFNWGNNTATARWNHIFNDKIFLNTSVVYSNYDYELGFGEKGTDAFTWKSNIINYLFKPEFTYYINTDNTMKFGGQVTYYHFLPGNATFWSDGKFNDISLTDKYSLESAIYAANEQKIGALVVLEYGLRYSDYRYMGKGYVYNYGNAIPGERKPLIGIKEFAAGELIHQYTNFEPRFSIKYDLTEKSSVKASYNRTTQYLHLLSNTAASSPLDVWTPSTNNVKPQISDQVALGYFRNIGEDNNYETSVETYYKAMQNQIDYIRNANILLNEQLEGDLLNGKGRAYGVEVMIKKTKGKLNGWISYTLARTERQVDGINRNDWFPAKFDKTHNLNVIANYDLTTRWSFSANFVFYSGAPSTFPTNRFEVQGYISQHNYNDQRNNYRITPYHRLDLSATLQNKKREGKNWESYWVFSVYNTYARRNAFSIYFKQNEDNPAIKEAIRLSIVGTFIPAISYNFKF